MRAGSAGLFDVLFSVALFAPANVHAQRSYSTGDVTVVVGPSGAHRVELVGGDLVVQAPDAAGVRRKTAGPGVVAKDVRLSFTSVNRALLTLIDAFIDGKTCGKGQGRNGYNVATSTFSSIR